MSSPHTTSFVFSHSTRDDRQATDANRAIDSHSDKLTVTSYSYRGNHRIEVTHHITPYKLNVNRRTRLHTHEDKVTQIENYTLERNHDKSRQEKRAEHGEAGM